MKESFEPGGAKRNLLSFFLGGGVIADLLTGAKNIFLELKRIFLTLIESFEPVGAKRGGVADLLLMPKKILFRAKNILFSPAKKILVRPKKIPFGWLKRFFFEQKIFL